MVVEAPFSSIGEVDFRELYYSQAGGFQQQWVARASPDWLARLRRRREIGEGGVDALRRRNTYVELLCYSSRFHP